MDVILEWGSEAWDIEGEHTCPLLADGASRQGAVSITSGAFEVLLEDLDTLELACELNMVEGGCVDVPDSRNVELLSVSGLNGIGVSVGAGGHQNEVSLAADLGDSDAVAGDNISDLFLMVVGFKGLNSLNDLSLGNFNKVGEHDIDSNEYFINY